jgi:hypothetical protein
MNRFLLLGIGLQSGARMGNRTSARFSHARTTTRPAHRGGTVALPGRFKTPSALDIY